MREICTSGSVRDGGGNVPIYSALALDRRYLCNTLWNSHVDATTLLGAARMAVRTSCRRPHAESLIRFGR